MDLQKHGNESDIAKQAAITAISEMKKFVLDHLLQKQRQQDQQKHVNESENEKPKQEALRAILQLENFVISLECAEIATSVEVVDKKLQKGLNELRKDLETEIDEKDKKLVEKIDKFEVSIEGLQREFKTGEWLKKEDTGILIKEYRKKNGVGLDEVREVAREVVERELERFAADGLGKVDYALASAGAVVVRHSKYGGFKRVENGVHDDSVKMISPNFGEPGQCFPLKGSSGFVDIRLRTSIVPEAVTLEHVAKSVAYDRTTAPKDCQIFGWLHKPDIINQMILLTEFTYDLEKRNAQTFEVLDTPIVVDTIRFNFTSNHGNPARTCIYRLRVHGHES